MAVPHGWSFRGRRIEDADFTGTRLHGPNVADARIADAWLHNTDIEGDIEGLRVNGVEVAPLVEAELDRRFPERARLRADDPPGLADAWLMIEAIWRTTVAGARALPEPLWFERVDDEWSFVETLRHLILATDCWLGRMVRQLPRPHHPLGLAGSFLGDPSGLGLDYAATPSLDEVLRVRRERMDMVERTIAALTPAELERVCVPPSTPGHPTLPHTVRACLHVILDEEWLHSRYANRDLDVLERRRSGSG